MVYSKYAFLKGRKEVYS